MDLQLLKYRFGRTLQLFQSCYSFGTDTTPISWAHTPCKYVYDWFISEGYSLTFYKNNSWIVNGIYDRNIIRLIIELYYGTTGNKCKEF
jgi:hypothetical protein